MRVGHGTSFERFAYSCASARAGRMASRTAKNFMLAMVICGRLRDDNVSGPC